MNILRRIALAALAVALLAAPAMPQSAQTSEKPGENAALRYWSAFAQLQDMGLTDAQAKELYRIVEGNAPFVPSTYKELIARNRPALETMASGTELPYCDWGIDYRLGPMAPLDHVGKAAQLGRLNVLYAMQLEMNDPAAAVKTLAVGLRFSHDVASGGTLLSALLAKSLLMAHLRVMASVLQKKDLTAGERATLRNALARIGPDGVDWQAAVKRELAILSRAAAHCRWRKEAGSPGVGRPGADYPSLCERSQQPVSFAGVAEDYRQRAAAPSSRDSILRS